MNIWLIILISVFGGVAGVWFCISIAKMLLKLTNKILPPNTDPAFLNKSDYTGNKGNCSKIGVNGINCFERFHEYITIGILRFKCFINHNILNVSQRCPNPSKERDKKNTDGDIKSSLPVHKDTPP
jgi:hypothetical protein